VEVQRNGAQGERGREGEEWQQRMVVSRTLTARFDWRVHGCFKNGLYLSQDLLYSGLIKEVDCHVSLR